jgi:hypothetical protein
MRAFEVSLNGKKLCLAGIGDDGVLTTIVNWVTGEGIADLFLEVGGLVSFADEHVSWIKQKPLQVGDSIKVKIVEAKSVDNPTRRRRTHPAERLRAQKRYVREMAKKLGWKIQTRSKNLRPKT